MTFKEYVNNISITKDDIDLDMQNIGLIDIYGIEKYTKLKHINLKGNLIEDISPIKNLKNINFLYLNDNKILDISPIKDLSKIDTLFFSRNKIKDISSLKNLNLESLGLSDNFIEDIETLYYFKNLKEAWIYNNPIPFIYEKYREYRHCLYLKNIGEYNLTNLMNIIKYNRRRRLIKLI